AGHERRVRQQESIEGAEFFEAEGERTLSQAGDLVPSALEQDRADLLVRNDAAISEPAVALEHRYEGAAERLQILGLDPRFLPATPLAQKEPHLVRTQGEQLLLAQVARPQDGVGELVAALDDELVAIG